MTDGTITGVVATSDRQNADAALVQALEERGRLWAEALHARALGHEVRVASELLHKHETSRSWRVSAPLRRIGARLQAVASRAGRGRPTPSSTSSARRS
jgi:hypothetical protein